MFDAYEELEEMCTTVTNAIGEANDKIRKNGGHISAGDAEYLDRLSHIMKSNKTSMAMMDSEFGETNRAYNDGSYGRGRTNARGRGRNARRDSMGRYSSRRSYDDDMDDMD